MGLKKFGKEGVGKDELNEVLKEGIQQSALNLIRQLQDRNVSFSDGQIDGFAEAYVDSDGQTGSASVNKFSSTGAQFLGSSFGPAIDNIAGEGSTSVSNTVDNRDNSGNNGSWSNTSNYYDGTSSSTNYNYNPNNADQESVREAHASLTETFTSTYVNQLFYEVFIDSNWSDFPSVHEAYVEVNDSGGWTRETTIADGGENIFGTFSDTITIGRDISGVRFQLDLNYDTDGSTTADLFGINFNINETLFGPSGNGIISHALDSSTVSSSDSTAIGVPFIANVSSGDAIEFRLDDGSNQTPWFDCTEPKVVEFTSLPSEPQTVDVRLVPNNSQSGSPEIEGFYLKTS